MTETIGERLSSETPLTVSAVTILGAVPLETMARDSQESDYLF